MGIKQGLFTIAATGLLVALSGCGSSATTAASQTSSPSRSGSPSTAPGASATAAAAPVLITIKDFMYTVSGPVAHGAKVTVKNSDSQSHTVTSVPKGAFDVTVAGGGGSATLTAPTKPGTYKFVCSFHANMMGSLVVT